MAVWSLNDLTFERAYRAAFQNIRGEIRTDAIDIATKLLPMTEEPERTRALKYVEDINRTAGPKELQQEHDALASRLRAGK